MATPDVLTEARDLISRRLEELRGEIQRLERALAELDSAPKRRGRPPKSASATPAKNGRRRRRRRGGARADQAVTIIADNPGITASQIAQIMKIKPNYLYRVLGDLEKEGRVNKDGRKYTVAS